MRHRKGTGVAAALIAALLVLGLAGCYRGGESESAHTQTVDEATFTAVRDAIKDSGLQVGGRDILMYRESETRIRAEGEFSTEDGKGYGTVWVEKSGENWKVVEKK